ncbi:hypothetical protein GCM10023156_18170 [Novipirellula rosea]|uniref:Uncharacterized protein n=1 Tax=Novipirellula rosea TaxID=1031540 RepID=A0ABP8MKF2_9BACT
MTRVTGFGSAENLVFRPLIRQASRPRFTVTLGARNAVNAVSNALLLRFVRVKTVHDFATDR